MDTLPQIQTLGVEFDDFVRFRAKFTALRHNNSNLGIKLASYKAAIGLRGSDGFGCLSLLIGIRNFLALLSVFQTIDAL